MWNRRHRWLRRLATGLAFAAVVTPAAQARIAEDSGVAGSNDQTYVNGYQGGPLAAYSYGQSSGYVNGYAGGPLAAYGYMQAQRAKDVRAAANDGKYVLHNGVWKQAEALRPDDRAVRFTPQAGASDRHLVVRPDDRATRISPHSGLKGIALRPNPGVGVSQPESQPIATPATGDGFNWSDAGIGAGIAFGLLLLGLGAGRLTRHLGRGATVGA